MRIITRLRRIFADRRGTQAVELAFIMPVLILLTSGVIDFGRMLYAINGVHKAAQWGAQTAITRDPVLLYVRDWFRCEAQAGRVPRSENGLSCADANAAIKTICNFGAATCTSAGCSWQSGTYNSAGGAVDVGVFNAILQRMQTAYPPILPNNVRIEYRPSPLGFVGKPTPSAEVSVTVQNVPFQFLLLPINGLFANGPVILSAQTVTLTTEDLSDNTCAEQGYALDNSGTRCQTARNTGPFPAAVCR